MTALWTKSKDIFAHENPFLLEQAKSDRPAVAAGRKMYSAATALRLRLKQPQKANVPVICIGNLTAGGTGKTPVAAAMVTLLRQCGYNPAFVSRGYGGNLSGVIVDREKHTARQVGD